MGKRGLSQVVTTVLIILIVLAAIAILWISLRNSLENSARNIGTERFTVNVDIVDDTLDYSGCNVNLSVQRPVGQGEILYLKFVLTSSSGETEVVNYPSEGFEPGEFQELETLEVSFSCNLPDLESISVYPVFANEVVGDNSDEEEFPDIPECSDGFDNDGDLFLDGNGNTIAGGVDFIPVDFNNDGITEPADDGCYSPEDDDETPVQFYALIHTPSDNSVVTVVSPAELILEFQVINPDLDINIIDLQSCWYELNGETFNIPNCLNDESIQSITIPVNLGLNELTLFGMDESGDVNQISIEFTTQEGEISITSPYQYQVFDDSDEINLEFRTVFEPSSCKYSINDGEDIAIDNCGDLGQPISVNLGSGEVGHYNLEVIATELVTGEEYFASVDYAVYSCPGEFGGDGFVDGADIAILLSNYGESDSEYDLNGDGIVNELDLGILLGNWGTC